MRFGSTRRPAPKSNLQRQREFRARNPHYYRDLHRKRKAEQDATRALVAQHPELTFVQAYAIVKGQAPAPAEQPTAPAPLALPAAISEPLVTVQLPLFAEPEAIELRTHPTPAEVVQQYKDAA